MIKIVHISSTDARDKAAEVWQLLDNLPTNEYEQHSDQFIKMDKAYTMKDMAKEVLFNGPAAQPAYEQVLLDILQNK